MQFFIDLGIGFLTAYLAFTNLLADKIIALLPEEPEQAVVEEVSQASPFPTLPTFFKEGRFTDILLKSTEYQKATALDSLRTNNTITDPLAAMVNIFCTFTTPTSIRTTTGTGFFVHSDGVIITNAHVAQYLLLGATDKLGDAECLVRQGNPAMAKYNAELLYIPPTWVEKNASVISDAVPLGTGERDYALLYVTKTIDGTILPTNFPALDTVTEYLPRSVQGSTVRASGYPATDLFRNGANSPLLAVSATTTISELYTFGSNYADVFSIQGSAVGAEGSSGGPVVNKEGKVIGIIVTRGDDAIDGKGSLRAITLSHVHQTILEETGFSLEKNISGDLALRSEVFTKTLAPVLISLLSQELKQNPI